MSPKAHVIIFGLEIACVSITLSVANVIGTYWTYS